VRLFLKILLIMFFNGAARREKVRMLLSCSVFEMHESLVMAGCKN
jgi:hypothetical protein